MWHYNFQEIDNPFIKALTDGFSDIDNNRKTLETVQDGVRWFLHLYFPQTMGFGNFTIFWQPCLKLSMKCNQSYIHVGTIMFAK